MTCTNVDLAAIGEPPDTLQALMRWTEELVEVLCDQLPDIDYALDFPSSLIGTTYNFAGKAAKVPTGFMLCYGQAISRTTYAALFTAIGTQFGAGNGTTTFNLPDSRDRVIVHKGDMGGVDAARIANHATTTMGATGGASAVAMGEANMVAHTHRWQYSAGLVADNNTFANFDNFVRTFAQYWGTNAFNNVPTGVIPNSVEYIVGQGGGGAIDLMAPYSAFNRMIYTGVK